MWWLTSNDQGYYSSTYNVRLGLHAANKLSQFHMSYRKNISNAALKPILVVTHSEFKSPRTIVPIPFMILSSIMPNHPPWSTSPAYQQSRLCDEASTSNYTLFPFADDHRTRISSIICNLLEWHFIRNHAVSPVKMGWLLNTNSRLAGGSSNIHVTWH